MKTYDIERKSLIEDINEELKVLAGGSFPTCYQIGGYCVAANMNCPPGQYMPNNPCPTHCPRCCAGRPVGYP